MFNLDVFTNGNNKEHNRKLPYIPDHPYRMLMIGGCGSGKTNLLLNLIKEHLYEKDLNEPKYQSLIQKREDAGIKHLNDPKTLIEYLNTMDDFYNNIDDYNPKRKRNILIVFDGMIADINTNKKLQFNFK